jgi:hypothetical protein
MKFSGLILIAVMLASMVFNANEVLEVNSRRPVLHMQQGESLAPLIQNAQTLSKQAPQLEALIAQLDKINKISNSEPAFANLISLPVVPEEAVQEPVAGPVVRKRTAHFNYKVTMVYVSPTDKYAVIDGDFAREGETLANGAKVISIAKGQVVLLKQGVRQTVKIKQS